MSGNVSSLSTNWVLESNTYPPGEVIVCHDVTEPSVHCIKTVHLHTLLSLYNYSFLLALNPLKTLGILVTLRREEGGKRFLVSMKVELFFLVRKQKG